MNQNFYYYGRLFFGLGAATSLLHAIVYFLTGAKLPGFDSFLLWLIAVKLITLGGAVFLLKYYLHKKYWLPFSGGMLVVLGNVLLTITTVMLIVARKGHSFHIATIISTTLASLLYGVTLIIPAAGRQLWLHIAGLAILCISIVYAGAIYLALQTPLQVNETAVALEQWIVLAGAFVPLLFFMQFLREERLLKAEAASLPPSKSNETILAPLGLIVFLLTLIAGVMIAKDGIGSVVWDKVNAARGAGHCGEI